MAPQEQRPKDRVIKPKNARAKRALLARAPRQVETLKKALLMHSGKTSGVLKALLGDLGALKAGESLKLSRKNAGVRPFEGGGEASLEFLARKADCSLFALGSHSKKRPHNLVLGRLFDFRLLDMVEFGVENYKAIRDFGAVAAACARGSKPCLVFSGDGFETDETLRTAKSLLLDFFRGRVVPNINLRGLDRAIIFTAVGQRILFRQCAIRYKKSGSKLPRIELTESGPRFDLAVRRHREAPPELRKVAYTAAKAPKKHKNVGEDALIGKVGHVFVPRQEVDELGLSKPKGVKRGRRESAAAGKAAARAGGGGGGGEEGDEATPVRGRKRRTSDADTPAGGLPGSHQLSEGNLTAGKGLKKPKRAKSRAPVDDDAF